MAGVIHSGEFFVAAGPVQPDRPCYIERDSDDGLLEAIRDQHFCYVLSPRASGKSSLMARAIRVLRSEGQLAAVVDLTQIGARGESEKPGRWYYGIAYRIVRELRLKVELQTWWQEKSALRNDERLAEFFWEVVLTNTTVPVTIFFDEIERAVELPFSKDLFTAIHSCYSSRTTEPDFARLNFVVLGVASPEQLAPDRTVSPFDLGTEIELDDFTLEQTYSLVPGFPTSKERAKSLLDRIYRWAGGQPYLTQKISRGVVRRGAELDDVDTVVRERFLAQGARSEEPLLNHIRTVLTRAAPGNRSALGLLAKLGDGMEVVADPGSVAQRVLGLAGLSVTSSSGRVILRNRLYRTVFDPTWASNSLPFNWRAAAAVGVAVLVMIALPWWYSQILPRDYIDSLSVVDQPIDAAYETYSRLHRLPGFGSTADELFTRILTGHSADANDYPTVRRVDELLRAIAGAEDQAEELLGGYWLRRAEDATRQERRDEALLLSAAAIPGQGTIASLMAAELIGGDYTFLQRSYRLSDPPDRWEVDWGEREIVVVAPDRRVRRLSIDEPRSTEFPDGLTALEHVPVRRELSVDEPGSAGDFVLELDVSHLADEQVLVSLEAPDGARASFTLPSGVGDTREFRALGRSPLAGLSDADRQGVWRLALVDREEGLVGELARWGLTFAEELRGWNDDPAPDLPVPDPLRTDQVEVTMSADGLVAVAQPSRDGPVGTLSLWDLRTLDMAEDLVLDSVPDHLALAGDTSRLLAVAGNNLTLWNTTQGASVASLATQTGFLLPPALSTDGNYIAIAELLDPQDSLYSLLRTVDGELVASVAGVADVRGWLLGPQARYLALLGSTRSVRLLDPRQGDVIAELEHDLAPVRMLSVGTGDSLITIDEGGDIFVWDVVEPDATTSARRRLGVTVDPQSVSVAANGSMVAFEAFQGHVVARDLAGESEPVTLRVHRSESGIRTRLAPDGSQLVTSGGPLLQLWQIDDRLPGAGTDLNVSALALDRAGRIAALGFRDGHIQVLTASQLETRSHRAEGVGYVGHQGGVSSIAVDAALGMIVSGGDDGLVRIWEIASGAPVGAFMRHPEAPIHAVALSPDGNWILSGGESSAMVWTAADGELSGEVLVNGSALTVAFSPQSDRMAIGDSAGNLFFALPEGAAPLSSAQAQDAVLTMAFSPDGSLLATGDASGRVQLWDATSGTTIGDPRVFPHPVRWVGFSDEDGYIVAQTDHWLHRLLRDGDGFAVFDSRLLEVGLEAGAALATPRGDVLQLVGGRGLGQPMYYELDLSEPAVSEATLDPALLERDWSEILGLRLDDSGAVVTRQP